MSVISGLISLTLMPLAGLWFDGSHGWTLILGSNIFRFFAALIAFCVNLLSFPSVGLWIGVLGFAIANVSRSETRFCVVNWALLHNQ
ncbi:hypothetical protein [Nonomuraea sp. NPDC049129]|uniref:hypothetical protein n=1 Tax=Nonomuraea sp. NPDC049129 TaxID=3155272 RepID=UPI0033F782A4